MPPGYASGQHVGYCKHIKSKDSMQERHFVHKKYQGREQYFLFLNSIVLFLLFVLFCFHSPQKASRQCSVVVSSQADPD